MPAPTQVDDSTAVQHGEQIFKAIMNGTKFSGRKPQEAVWLLMYLAQDGDNRAFHTISAYSAYGATPKQAQISSEGAVAKLFIANSANNVEKDLIEHWTQKARSESPPDWKTFSWKNIRATAGATGCTNAMARRVRRLLRSVLPRKEQFYQSAEQIRAFTEFSPGELNAHPVTAFVNDCWNKRKSSISSNLCKHPPKIVNQILQHLATAQEPNARDSLRAFCLSKMAVFEDWAAVRTGGASAKYSPAVLSDVLSKFANAIKPHIQRYNTMADSDARIVHPTSFVPGDLAPQMYRGTCTAYFLDFGNAKGHLYYVYSPQWREDAVWALTTGRVSSNLFAADQLNQLRQIDLRIFRAGGSELKTALEGGRDEAGRVGRVTPELWGTHTGNLAENVIKFLQQYYMKSLFLQVNLLAE